MGFDPDRTGSLDDVYDMEMRMNPGDAVVFMNLEDLKDSRKLVGGTPAGTFANIPNGGIQDLEAQGVKFYGVPYMLPGTFLILPRYALNIITYFDELYTESFKFHLVDNWIRHTMLKVVAFGNVPGHFGSMAVFQPSSV